MPTILLWNGFRFHFYSNEKGEPAHIHVSKSGCSCKFWLPEITLAYNDGFKHNELRIITQGVAEHKDVLLGAWIQTHGH
jgi:Domain of unknown function (DUF4160)